jgi:hypothetical protein
MTDSVSPLRPPETRPARTAGARKAELPAPGTIRMVLTRNFVEGHPLPRSGRLTLACTNIRGFQVVLTANGSRTYRVECRRKGASRTAPTIKYRFGEVYCDGKGLKFGHAQKKANELLNRLRAGEDIRPQEVSGGNFANAYTTFITARELRARTLGHYQAAREALDGWAQRPLRAITPGDVKAEFIRLQKKHGTASASQVFRLFRAVWNFHFAEDNSPPLCPTAVLSRARANLWMSSRKRRTRIVPADKLPAWWAAVAKLPNNWPLYFQTQLLSGTRKTELLLLRPEYISATAKTITLPAEITKPKRELVLPLGPWALARLKAAKPRKGGALFGAETQHKRHVRRVVDEIGVAWGSHDLRRMFRNAATACGVPDIVAKALLNHSLASDITDSYSTDIEKPKRDALVKIERYLLKQAKARR